MYVCVNTANVIAKKVRTNTGNTATRYLSMVVLDNKYMYFTVWVWLKMRLLLNPMLHHKLTHS